MYRSLLLCVYLCLAAGASALAQPSAALAQPSAALRQGDLP